MVRFTFVVGGGKLVRARYDEDLPRWLGTALRELGFSEDRGAAETFDSQGTFKQQHDTGQNLKYLIVYPYVDCANRKADVTPAEEQGLDTSSQEYIVSASTLEIFKNLVASKTQSWSQKKRLLKLLQDGADAFRDVEAKLVSGVALTPREQAVYEANSGEDAAKVSWLQAEIKTMADGGGLTAVEQKELLETLGTNLLALEEELARARAENQPKKAEKLEEKRAAVAARRALIQKAPVVVHRLKRGEEVRKLRLRLLPLLALEERGRSQSLTLADLKTLEDKGELEAAIAALEAGSRGWCMTDEEFVAMCAIEADAAAKKYKEAVKAQAAKSASKGPAKGGAQSNSWATVGSGAKKSAPGSGASKGTARGNSFAAAFDSDSD